MRAHDVAVEDLDERAALLELVRDERADGRLAGCGEAREPDDEAAHCQPLLDEGGDLVEATVWMPHSVLSVPAQRPERPAPGCVECVSPIES